MLNIFFNLFKRISNRRFVDSTLYSYSLDALLNENERSNSSFMPQIMHTQAKNYFTMAAWPASSIIRHVLHYVWFPLSWVFVWIGGKNSREIEEMLKLSRGETLLQAFWKSLPLLKAATWSCQENYLQVFKGPETIPENLKIIILSVARGLLGQSESRQELEADTGVQIPCSLETGSEVHRQVMVEPRN